MKDCPSCGASVPDSAAQCPSCRHAFEESPEKGRTLLGVPAEEVPSSPEDGASGDSSAPEGSGDSATSDDGESETGDPTATQFGLPAADADSEESPRIDTSADGPDEAATDWSDLDDVVDEESEASILRAPGSSSAAESGEDAAEAEEGAGNDRAEPSTPAGASAGSGAQDPSDPASGSSDDASSEGTSRRRPDPEADPKRTQMGMPRFDPDRVAGEEPSEGEDSPRGVDGGDTSPGSPGEAKEDSEPEIEPTAEFNIDSLKAQVEESEAERDEEGDEAGPSSGDGGASDEETDADPSSTMHGKAAKALSAEMEADEDDEEASGRDKRQTMGGLFGKNTYMQEGGSEASEPEHLAETSSAPAAETRDEEESEAEGGRSTRETQLGQPVQTPGSESDTEEEPGESEPESALPMPGEIEDDDAASSEAAEEDETTAGEESGASGFGGPTGFEIADESDEISVEGGDAADNWGRRDEEAEPRRPEGTEGASLEPESPAEPSPPGGDGEDAGAPDMQSAVGLAPSSAPDDLFDSIEEESSDTFADADLEEVDVRADGDSVAEEFEFFDEDVGAEPDAAASDDDRAVSEDQETVQVERPDDLMQPDYDLSGEPGSPEQENDAPISGESEESGSPPELDFDDEPEREPVETVEPTQTVPEINGLAQTLTAILAGLTLGAFVAMQTMSGGLFSHFLVLTLSLASGLGAVTHLLLPFIPVAPGTKSAIYLGFGVLVAALSVVSLVLVAQGLQVTLLVALCGGISAVTAGLIPTFVAAFRSE